MKMVMKIGEAKEPIIILLISRRWLRPSPCVSGVKYLVVYLKEDDEYWEIF
jgi:hypothetical protein